MCAPAAIIAVASAFAASQMSRRQQQTTPQIPRNEPPPARAPRPAAMSALDPERIRKEDEDIKVTTTPKQKRDRKRVREGLKTLGAVDPASSTLPSAPAMGISGVPGATP
jgi:hypothetical protein